MTVRLRAHHLLCMLTHVGRGYTPSFTRTMAAVLDRLSAGEQIELVEGPDEICAGWLDHPDSHCHLARIGARDRRAAEAVGGLLGRALHPSARLDLTPEILARMRAAFAAGSTRQGCLSCEWAQLCTAVAASGFAGTRLGKLDRFSGLPGSL